MKLDLSFLKQLSKTDPAWRFSKWSSFEQAFSAPEITSEIKTQTAVEEIRQEAEDFLPTSGIAFFEAHRDGSWTFNASAGTNEKSFEWKLESPTPSKSKVSTLLKGVLAHAAEASLTPTLSILLKNTSSSQPLRLGFRFAPDSSQSSVTKAGSSSSQTAPTCFKIKISIEAHASAEIVQEFSPKTGSLLLEQNIAVAEASELNLYLLSLGSSKLYLHSNVEIASQGKASATNLCHSQNPESVFHNEQNFYLQGKKAQAAAHGITFCKLGALSENYSAVHHQIRETLSEQLFKNILGSESKAFFRGEIHIAEGADLSSANQLSRGMLLSTSAQSITEPVLNICADEVEAAHGSSTGELNAEELFYLESRGIDAELAKQMLLEGFALEVIEKIKFDKLTAWSKKQFVKGLKNTEPSQKGKVSNV